MAARHVTVVSKTFPLLFRGFKINRQLYSPNKFITLNYCNYLKGNEHSSLQKFDNSSPNYDRQQQIENSEFGPDRPTTNNDRQWLLTLVQSTSNLTTDEWKDKKMDILRESNPTYGLFTDKNFESLVMIACCFINNVELAHSLFAYHTQTEKLPNVVTLSKYIRLLGSQDGEVNEEYLLTLIQQLTDRYKLLDCKTAEDLIFGLCRTSSWKDSFKYLEMMKLTQKHPTASALSRVTVRAFEVGEFEMGWNTIHQTTLWTSQIDFEIEIKAWIVQCKKSPNLNNDMQLRLLNFLRDNEITVSREVAYDLKHLFESVRNEEWVGEVTKMSMSGICKACNCKLEALELTTEEFDLLKNGFLNRVIKGKDLYLKTSPKELERFLNFMKYTAPYSVVLDGLNVAYSAPQNSNKVRRANQLLKVVRHFTSEDRKVLVLGKDHMKSWPREILDKIKRESIIFFAEDLSKDDPFLLYAALYSGPGTMFLSKDMMRDHLFALSDNHLATLFRKWRLAHQIELITVLPNDTIYSKPPLKFNPVAQESENSWHVPFYADEEKSSVSWLCMKRIGTNQVALPKSKLNVQKLFANKIKKN